MTARASQAWADARERDDFQSFAPWLERVFALAREEADAVGFIGERYQALLDDYEPGMTLAPLEALFERLETALVPLAHAVRVERPPQALDVLAREFPLERQPVLARQVAAALAFDLGAAASTWGRTVLHGHRPGDIRGAALPRATSPADSSPCCTKPGMRCTTRVDPAQYGTVERHRRSSRVAIAPVGESRGRSPGSGGAYPQIGAPFRKLHDVSMDEFRAR